MITPDYIIERGKKIAEVFVNGIFKNFIENWFGDKILIESYEKSDTIVSLLNT
jgi:hypothetical protein